MTAAATSGVRLRPLERDDVAALEPIDRAYAERYRVEPVVSLASLSLYARSGHSFVAEPGGAAEAGGGPDAGTAGGALGFVLAQAVWTGARPVLRLARLALAADPRPGTGDDASGGARDEAAAGLRALLAEAVVKSAYDAAVYDLEAVVPDDDAGVHAALERLEYQRRAARVYTRTLGSRGRT